MPGRQILIVAITIAIIVGTAVVILSWDGGSDLAVEEPAPVETTTTVAPTTSTTTTTIPLDCLDTAGIETTTTTVPEGDDAPTTSLVWPTLGPNDSVSTVGIGEIDFGMTVRQAEAASGTWLSPCSAPSDCYWVTPSPAPEGLSFLVTEGTIERLDVVAGPVATRSGIGIESTEAEVRETFGDQIETIQIDDATSDLVFVPADTGDAEFRVVFTVRDGAVESLRSGRLPQILEQNPCSGA